MLYKNYIKRFIDFVISITILFLLWPLLLIIYLLIKLFDKGPAIYKQTRTGLNGKNFTMYKFRTMNNIEKSKEFSMCHEKRVTKIGKFLRKTSLDELPQLLNVLKGDMSIVGPRPWIVDYYKNFNDEQKRRVEVRPGIVGLAQAKGRNGLDVLTKIKYDLEYIDNLTFLMDIKVIYLSVIIILKKSHAEILQEDIFKEIEILKLQNKGV